MLASTSRLELAREVRATTVALQRLPATDERGAAELRTRRSAMLASLLGRGRVVLPGVNLADPDDVARALQAALDDAAAEGPTQLAVASAYVGRVGSAILRSIVDPGRVPAGHPLRLLASQERPLSESQQQAVFDWVREAGAGTVDVARKAGALIVQRREALKQITESLSSQWPAVSAQLETESEHYRSALNALYANLTERGPGQSNQDDWSKFEALREKYNSWRQARWSELVGEKNKPAIEAQQALDAARKEAAAHGQQVLDRLREASPVTQAEAEAWAKAQTITKTATARLEKSGYSVSAVRRDMAEFYRLTGGRLPSVLIDSSGGTRASASGVRHGATQATILLGSAFDKRVLWHELAHHLEEDPRTFAAAKGFLLARRQSSEMVKLRTLNNGRGYRADEMAYVDSWFSIYIGKIYGHASTEVVSMGLESFSDPALLAQRIGEDPQMFELLMGMLLMPEDPLWKSTEAARLAQAESLAEVAKAKGDRRASVLARLAKGVEFGPGPAPAPGDAPLVLLALYSGSRNDPAPELIGFHAPSDTYAFWIMARNNRGRRVKAVAVVSRSIAIGQKSYRSIAVCRGGLQEAKVAARIWADGQSYGEIDVISTESLERLADQLNA